MHHLISLLKKRIKQAPWLYRLCLKMYFTARAIRHPALFVTAVKRFIKQKPWLYKLCLKMYFTARAIRYPALFVTAVKRFIKQKPWLYKLCLKMYFTARTALRVLVFLPKTCAQTIRIYVGRAKDEIRKRPHLLIYATYCKFILQGKISAGLRGINAQARMDIHNWRSLQQNRLAHEKLTSLHQEAVLCCIRNHVHKWWNYLPSNRLDSVPGMQSFLHECVLSRAGDYKEFLRLRGELKRLPLETIVKDDFFDKLAQYYSDVMDEIAAGKVTRELKLDKSARRFLIGFSVWGEHYIGMFAKYCLPSIMTQGNLGTLCNERQVIFLIHTDAAGKLAIEQLELMKQAQAMGVKVLYRMINQELIGMFNQDTRFKYWHLGLMQSIELYCAQALDADFHLLLPDTVYSENHFHGLLAAAARGEKVISRLGLSTRMEGICPELEAYRHNGSIIIPAGDLAALSVAHVHAACAAWIGTNRNLTTELPNVYMIVWEGKDTLHMMAAHQTLLYLDREIVRGVRKRFFMTLDSELDKLVPDDCPTYCPRPQDGIYLIEITPEHERGIINQSRNPIDEFARLFWYSTQASMAYWRFFELGIIDPMNRDLIPDREYMTDREIDNAKATIKNALLERYPATTPEQAYKAMEILQQVKQHSVATYMVKEIKNNERALQQLLTEPLAPQALAAKKQRKSMLTDLYQRAILSCIRNNVHKWWSVLLNDKFDSIHVLHQLLRDSVLRRGGDYQEFLNIHEELNKLAIATPPADDFLVQMIRYYVAVMENMDAKRLAEELSLDTNRRCFVIGFSVWGEHYLRILTDYCLPSLLTEGNLGILCKERQPVFLIHTNPEGEEQMERSDAMQRARAMGVKVMYRMVNPALVSRFNEDPSHKYWHLGMVQSLDIYYAKTLGADYHLLMPDTIYSSRHFAGLLNAAAQGHHAIVRLILSTRMEGICPIMDSSYRRDGVIDVPAADLAALSVLHIHSASHAWIVTGRDLSTEGSNVHVLAWEGEDTLRMHSPHQTLLYLDHQILAEVPKRYFMTLDSELEKVIPSRCPVYCPKPQDEAGLIEMTSEKQRAAEPPRSDIKEFCRVYWYGAAQESMDYWRIFNEAVIDPLNRSMLAGRPHMSQAEIEHAESYAKQALLKSYPKISQQQAEMALRIVDSLRSHPDAHDMQQIFDRAIGQIHSLNNENPLQEAA